MEFTIDSIKYILKESLSVDEFLQVGFPPMAAFKDNNNDISGEDYLRLMRYQKKLLTALTVEPKTPNLFGTIDLAIFNTIVTDKKFLSLFERLFTRRIVQDENVSPGELPKHPPTPTTT